MSGCEGIAGCVGKVCEDCVGEVLPVDFETHSSCITGDCVDAVDDV